MAAQSRVPPLPHKCAHTRASCTAPDKSHAGQDSHDHAGHDHHDAVQHSTHHHADSQPDHQHHHAAHTCGHGEGAHQHHHTAHSCENDETHDPKQCSKCWLVTGSCLICGVIGLLSVLACSTASSRGGSSREKSKHSCPHVEPLSETALAQYAKVREAGERGVLVENQKTLKEELDEGSWFAGDLESQWGGTAQQKPTTPACADGHCIGCEQTELAQRVAVTIVQTLQKPDFDLKTHIHRDLLDAVFLSKCGAEVNNVLWSCVVDEVGDAAVVEFEHPTLLNYEKLMVEAPTLWKDRKYSKNRYGPKTPITVFTGELGAGKTTLLSTLFKSYPTLQDRVAVLENEFSTVSIDSSLVNDGGKGTVKGFSGNCLCCLSGNPVLDALYQFTVYPEKESQFLAVLLELSGAADPLTVVQDLQPNVPKPGEKWYSKMAVQRVVAMRFRVDATIGVVNTKQMLRYPGIKQKVLGDAEWERKSSATETQAALQQTSAAQQLFPHSGNWIDARTGRPLLPAPPAAGAASSPNGSPPTATTPNAASPPGSHLSNQTLRKRQQLSKEARALLKIGSEAELLQLPEIDNLMFEAQIMASDRLFPNQVQELGRAVESSDGRMEFALIVESTDTDSSHGGAVIEDTEAGDGDTDLTEAVVKHVESVVVAAAGASDGGAADVVVEQVWRLRPLKKAPAAPPATLHAGPEPTRRLIEFSIANEGATKPLCEYLRKHDYDPARILDLVAPSATAPATTAAVPAPAVPALLTTPPATVFSTNDGASASILRIGNAGDALRALAGDYFWRTNPNLDKLVPMAAESRRGAKDAGYVSIAEILFLNIHNGGARIVPGRKPVHNCGDPGCNDPACGGGGCGDVGCGDAGCGGCGAGHCGHDHHGGCAAGGHCGHDHHGGCAAGDCGHHHHHVADGAKAGGHQVSDTDSDQMRMQASLANERGKFMASHGDATSHKNAVNESKGKKPAPGGLCGGFAGHKHVPGGGCCGKAPPKPAPLPSVSGSGSDMCGPCGICGVPSPPGSAVAAAKSPPVSAIPPSGSAVTRTVPVCLPCRPLHVPTDDSNEPEEEGHDGCPHCGQDDHQPGHHHHAPAVPQHVNNTPQQPQHGKNSGGRKKTPEQIATFNVNKIPVVESHALQNWKKLFIELGHNSFLMRLKGYVRVRRNKQLQTLLIQMVKGEWEETIEDDADLLKKSVVGLEKERTTMVVIGHYLAEDAFGRLFGGELGETK